MELEDLRKSFEVLEVLRAKYLRGGRKVLDAEKDLLLSWLFLITKYCPRQSSAQDIISLPLLPNAIIER